MTPDFDPDEPVFPYGPDEAYSLPQSPAIGLAATVIVAWQCRMTVRAVTMAPAHVEFLSDGRPSHILAVLLAGYHADRAVTRLPEPIAAARHADHIRAARDINTAMPGRGTGAMADYAARQLVYEHDADIRRLACALEDAPGGCLSADDLMVFALARGLLAKFEHPAFIFAGDKP
ncbi:hypothetical protein [Cupriavidus sp. SS-3]|uniref:hypothetical protein n=1 Tax=Cupriavidus sp. SS-3 TaxID=3109596 RepID=UPI002DBBF5B3|nr:hypothetical protein [Cupriavidus sp. SS-3]MEC3769055.1 hypothetical protein [Cupriavidus sp. SS-3]